MLYSRSSLISYFIRSINGLYMSIPISQFTPSSPTSYPSSLPWSPPMKIQRLPWGGRIHLTRPAQFMNYPSGSPRPTTFKIPSKPDIVTTDDKGTEPENFSASLPGREIHLLNIAEQVPVPRSKNVKLTQNPLFLVC